MAKNIDMPANIREIIDKYGENYKWATKQKAPEFIRGMNA